jgi:hypothetical protein
MFKLSKYFTSGEAYEIIRAEASADIVNFDKVPKISFLRLNYLRSSPAFLG